MQEALAEAAEPARKAPVRIEMVPPAAVDGIWPMVEERLAPLFDDYPLEDLEDVKASLETTNRQLWLVLKDGEITAVMVTQILIFPRARVFEILALEGTGVPDVIDEFNAWVEGVARQKNCSVIQAMGRDGWTKSFKKIGGSRAATVYRKVMV